MEFTQLINQRASIRAYDPSRPVSDDVLCRILAAARLSPSAANLQPSKFLLVTSPAKLSAVKESYHRDWFKQAPAVLAVCVSENQCWKRGFDGYRSFETDAAIMMTYLLLAAANEGVATCWISAFNPAILRSALELKDDEHVFAITPLGYPPAGAPAPEPKIRKELTELLQRI